MSDPLSIAASIAGVAGLADIVFNRLVKYGRMVKNAEKEIKDLVKEVDLLTGALESLKRLARLLEDGDFDESLRMNHIDACNSILMEMDKKLRKVDEKSVRQRLLWPFKNERVKEWMEELSRHRESINLALSANSLDAMLRVLAQADRNASEIVAEVKETRKITSRIHQDSERRKVLDFFLKYNPQQNYDMSLQLRHPRTGLWLQRLPDFQSWLRNPDSKLWLKGIPGAGKTVLAGSIIEAAIGKSTETIPSAFFFCDYKEPRTHEVETILMALVYQLAIQNEEAYTRLERYYEELHPFRGLPKAPKATALERLLKELVQLYDHVYLVVDGLDECGTRVDEVVDTLCDISEETDNVSMALLSRDENEIRDHLADEFISCSVEIAAHDEDITEYVTAEIAKRIENKKLHMKNPDLKGEILQGLVDGAKGMFRWVACQLDHLELCDSDQQCRDALKTLPPDLNTSYARILKRVPPSKIQMVQFALHCVAYGGEPKLTIRQLREVLSVPESRTFLEPSAIIREEAITKYCSSLIRKSADKLHFEFSHFSVQEFLENDSLRRSDLQTFWISKGRSKSLLTIGFLKFLQLKSFDHPSVDTETDKKHDAERNSNFKLYEYAATQWLQHARGEWENPEVLAHAKSLFHPFKTHNFTAWVRQLINSLGPRMIEDYLQECCADVRFTPLHMAATLSLPHICSFLLEEGVEADGESLLGTPLQCAVQGLHPSATNERLLAALTRKTEGWCIPDHADTDETINSLLQAGASTQISGTREVVNHDLLDVAFDRAWLRGSFDVPTTLIQSGAPLDHRAIEAARKTFRDCREYADFPTNIESLRLLVQTLNDYVDKSSEHLRLCRIAWEEAIHFNIDFTSGTTTIDTRVSLTEDDIVGHAITAVKVGNLQALQRVQRDPRIDLPAIIDENEDSLLHLALKYDNCDENLGILRMLLDAGCDVLKPNSSGQQPVQLWYWGKDTRVLNEVAAMLRERGVSCSHRDVQGRNALHSHVHTPSLLHALLSHQPADNIREAMETVDNDGFTPFSEALNKQYPESALVFIQEVTITPAMVQSPTSVLSLAVKASAGDVLEFLIQSGIEPDFAKLDNPMRYLGPKATRDFVHRLKSLFPESCARALGTEPPLALYLKSCLESSQAHVDVSVMDVLSLPDMVSVGTEDKSNVWKFLASHVLPRAQKLRLSIDLQYFEDHAREDSTMVAITSLSRLAYMESFESHTQKSGIIPLLDEFRTITTISDMWPISSKSLCLILEKTKHWSDIRSSARVVSLLGAAVRSCDLDLANLLLKEGTNVHQKVDDVGFSVLEIALFDSDSSNDPGARSMITLVLDHADKLRLNDTSMDTEGLTLLHRLQTKGSEWIVEELVKRGADQNRRMTGWPNSTPLNYHLSKSREGYAIALLKDGADPCLADCYKLDAALSASLYGCSSFLAELLAGDKDSKTIDWQRRCNLLMSNSKDQPTLCKVTALHLAAVSGFVGILRFYVDHRLIEDLDAVSDDGYTALHVAAVGGFPAAIEFLCERGCNVNARTADGSSPLHLAAKSINSQKSEVARLLVKAGCKPSRDSAGMYPSFWAYGDDDRTLCHWLQSIESSTDPAQTTHNKHTTAAISTRIQARALSDAFESAIAGDDLKRCQQLFLDGCRLDFPLRSCGGCSLLIKAIEFRRVDIIRWMLKEGADIIKTVCHYNPVLSALHLVLGADELLEILPDSLENYMEKGGRLLGELPPLIGSALEANDVKGLKLLLEHATEKQSHYGLLCQSPKTVLPTFVNEVDQDGYTFLHRVAMRGTEKVVQLLIDAGANIDAAHATTGQTALHLATLNSIDNSIAMYLINHGANLEARNWLGRTPVLFAAQCGNQPVLQALIDAKVNIEATDYRNQSLLHLLATAYNGSTAFAEFLRLGLALDKKNADGLSAFHLALFSHQFSSLLLNMDIRLEDMSPLPWNGISFQNAAWLTTAYPLFRKKYSRQTLQKFAQQTLCGFWSPLCILALRGMARATENLLELGVDINFEGCPLGSALMAACAAGQADSVASLVRHGAVLAYAGPNGIRSVISASNEHPHILRWLLVDRFAEQGKLAAGSPDCLGGGQGSGLLTWGGPVKAELVITGKLERWSTESSRDYWTRLMNEKIARRGKILPPNGTSRTSRSANLVPEEFVRVHPEGYELKR